MAKRRKTRSTIRTARKGARKLPKPASARALARDALKEARQTQKDARRLLREYEKEARKGAKANRRLLHRLLNQRYRRMSAIERLLGVYRPRSSRLTASRKATIRKAWARAEKLLARATKTKKSRKRPVKRHAGKPSTRRPTTNRTKRVSALDQKKLQIALKSLRADKSLSVAARDANLPRTTLRRFLEQSGLAEKQGRKWIVRDETPRRLLIYSAGQAIVITVPNLKAAKIVGVYMGHVGEFLKSNDPAFLGAFHGGGIEDIEGTRHTFETDPDTLYRLASTGSESFEQVYRIVI